MGNSVVLKDLKHRPKGYVRLDCDGVICRAQLDAPAQLTVLFSGGGTGRYALDGPQEQRFPCDGGQMRGCFVHRENTLLLVSDETMQEEFARHALRMQKSAQAGPAQRPDKMKAQGDTAETEKKIKEETEEEKQEEQAQEQEAQETEREQRTLPQRRWPPPPCWETACYRDGCWQERAPIIKD